jgi:hypothetical protein
MVVLFIHNSDHLCFRKMSEDILLIIIIIRNLLLYINHHYLLLFDTFGV